jgi:hypothetical protein
MSLCYDPSCYCGFYNMKEFVQKKKKGLYVTLSLKLTICHLTCVSHLTR